MTLPFFSLRPIKILADRSRDIASGWATVRLVPTATFIVTDNQALRLTSRLLSRYDLLVIAGIGGTPSYSSAELDAIEHFVRRGGTLLLASSAGVYSLRTGGPIDELVQQSVAARFGYGFVASDALATNLDALPGYARSELRLTRAAKRVGLELGDLPFERPGALNVPARSTVLLRAGPAGRPVMAWSAHGRGKVLVCHDTGVFNGWNGLPLAYLIAAVDPADRVDGERRRTAVVQRPIARSQHGAIALTSSAITRSQEQRMLGLARRVRRRVSELVPGHRFELWSIGLEAASGSYMTGWRSPKEVESFIGVWQSDASLTAVLANQLSSRVLETLFGRELRTMVWAMVGFVVDRVLRSLGFTEHADRLLRAFTEDPTASDRVDFGRVYSEVETPASLRRFWFDLSEAFGRDVLRRVCQLTPKEKPWTHIDLRFYTELDALAFLLAHAVGRDVYRYLRERGHTVREIPLAKPASTALGTAVDRALARVIEGRAEPTSDRMDAAALLAERWRSRISASKKPRLGIERALGSASAPHALPAALLLAATRDARGRYALRRLLVSRDTGLSAAAALSLVCDYRDARAADLLARLARHCDIRFQLAAGHALRLLGHRGAKALCFDGHRDCRMSVRRECQVRANPVVDGYEVANVYASPTVRPAPHGAGFSVYYVEWVHTAPRWRRRGLAHAGMKACLDSHWDRECAATSLHTGVRNVAHALYRQFGLTDYHRAPFFAKTLRAEPRLDPMVGITVRAVSSPAEWIKLVGVANLWTRTRPEEPREPGIWTRRHVAFAAYQGRRPVALVSSLLEHEAKAWIDYIAMGSVGAKSSRAKSRKRASDSGYEPREHVGLLLLSSLHAELRRRGVRTVRLALWRPPGDQDIVWLLRRAGYGSHLEGIVELYRINSLPQLLREARPALEARLSAHRDWSNWSGAIALEAPGQTATLVCTHGKLTVDDDTSKAEPNIVLRGALVALQRAVLGATSAFEEYLQIEIEASPSLNEMTVQLLETLFPRVTLET